jgi:hypothetical protein
LGTQFADRLNRLGHAHLQIRQILLDTMFFQRPHLKRLLKFARLPVYLLAHVHNQALALLEIFLDGRLPRHLFAQ